MPPNIKLNPTLRDLQMGVVNGKFDPAIVEMMLQANPIMNDFVVLPANNGVNDIAVIRTGMPTGTWKAFYQGVQPSKGSKKQVSVSAGTLSHLIQVDKEMVDRSQNKEAEMADEAFTHASQMSVEMCQTVFYGNVAKNARKFNGLSPIYSVLGTDASESDESSFYTLGAKRSGSGGNHGKLRSIWLVGHGRLGTYMFYPKGTTGGLQRGTVEDNRITLADGSRLKVYEQEFNWTAGLQVKDFRKNVRICNIELDKLQDGTLKDDLDLGRLMQQALVRADGTGVRQDFYMSKLMYEQLVLQIRDKKIQSGFFDFSDYEGKKMLHFQGVPVKICDGLETNEEEVSAAS